MGGRGEGHPISHVVLPALVAQGMRWELSYGGKSFHHPSDPAHSNTTLFPCLSPAPPTPPCEQAALGQEGLGEQPLMKRFSVPNPAEPSPSPTTAPRPVSPALAPPACLAIMLVIIWVMKHVLFLSVALINLLSI